MNSSSKTSFTIGLKEKEIFTQKRSKVGTTECNLLECISCKLKKIRKAVITKNACTMKKPKLISITCQK